MKIREWLEVLFPQYFKKVTPVVPVIPVIPVIPVPAPAPEPAPLCGCDLSGPLVDGPYDQAYMDANSHSEECRIEPETGLLVRYPVWIPSIKAWWMQSSIASGHVKLVGSKSNGTLVTECHTTKGFRYHVRGLALNEPRRGEANPPLASTGNEGPYNHTRRYVVAECRKASGSVQFDEDVLLNARMNVARIEGTIQGLQIARQTIKDAKSGMILFGYVVIVAAVAIVTILSRKLVAQ